MLLNRLTQSITAFVLTVAIARNLGTEALGQYLLAFSYYFIFVNIASQGLKILFTRELAREPEKTAIYLTSGSLLQFIFSLLGYLVLVIVVFLLPYSDKTSIICYVMGLTIIPFALSNIIEAIFQAQEKMHLIAISTSPIYILRLFVMIWAMQIKYGVEYIAVILVISETIILLIEWRFIFNIVKPKWQFDRTFMWDTIKAVRTLFAIEGAAVLSSRIQILILSLLGNETLVGIYGAITQLLQPFLIIANSVITAMFPSLSKAVKEGKKKQKYIAEKFIDILLVMAVPLFLGILVFSEDLLIFIYNPSFAQGSLAFKIAALSLLLLPFNRSLSCLLVANGLEKVNLREVFVTGTIGSLVGVLLIYKYQLIGAAIMYTFMVFLAANQYIYATYTQLFALSIWKMMRHSLIISFLMLPVFALLEAINIKFILIITIATFIYIIFVGLTSFNFLELFRALRVKLLK